VNVDTPQTIDCVEWCFGYGGNHLGLKRVFPSLRCIAASEIEAYASRIWSRKWKRDSWTRFLFGRTLKPSHANSFETWWISSLRATRASRSAAAGKRKGAMTRGISGLMCGGQLRLFDPDSSSLKMWKDTSASDCVKSLPNWLCSDTEWKTAVASQRGEYSRRLKLARRRIARGCSSSAARQGVDQDDALREQVERFYAGGFFNLAAGTGSGRLASANRQHHGTSGKLESETGARSETDPSGVGLANTSGQRFGKGRSKLQGRHGQLSSVVNGTMANSPESQRQEPAGKRNDRSERSFERSGQGCHGDGQAVANRGRGGEDWEPGELRTAGLEQPSGDSREANTGEGRKVALGVGQADSDESGLQGGELIGALRGRVASGATGEFCGSLYWPGFIARPGQEQFEWEPSRTIETKRGLGGGVNGRAANVDRLRLLGNGVYPVTAAKAFCELMMRFKR
jgi:hypothetical protein